MCVPIMCPALASRLSRGIIAVTVGSVTMGDKLWTTMSMASVRYS